MKARLRRCYELVHAINGWQSISIVVAMAALVLNVNGVARWIVAVLALLALGVTLLIDRDKEHASHLGTGLSARLFVMATPVVVAFPFGAVSVGWRAVAPANGSGVMVVDFSPGGLAGERLGAVALSAMVCCLAAEPMLRAFDMYVKPVAVRLRGAEYTPHHILSGDAIYWVNVLVGGVLIVLWWADVWATSVAVIVLAAAYLAFTAVMFVDRSLQFFAYRRANRRFVRALTDNAPEFAFYWDAPANTTFQAEMWLPYLERVGRKFIVVMRNRVDFAEVAAMTTAPVVYRAALNDLDDIIVPSLQVVCYVNSASRNTHMLRYPTLRHIQLNHGDSDKAPSVNPNFRAYDRDFVAGQAAIERFAHAGVHVQDDLFRIVGRPQVEGIALEHRLITEVAEAKLARPEPLAGPLTVLYAPTWAGANDDSQYCSLPVAEPMIRELLRRGLRVMFRPHGYTYKDPALQACADDIDALLKANASETGLDHVTSEGMATRTFVDCVNESDAMIADVSSVVSDYLFSEKPLAMVAVSAKGDEFVEDFPIAAVAYVFDADMSNLSAHLDAMLGDDPLRDARRAAKAHYLGDFALRSSGAEYVDHFVRALCDEIDEQAEKTKSQE